MANDGYLTPSGVCSSLPFEAMHQLCVSNSPSYSAYSAYFFKKSGNNIYCYNSSYVNSGSFYFNLDPNCQISSSSSIPTVADGITLGWQAGGALILVGCILFLKKALK